MKIVGISDTHGQHNSLKRMPKADMLLFAGDVLLNRDDNGHNFVEWLNSLPIKHKVGVFGNHDFNYRAAIEYSKHFKDIHFLMNEAIEIEGMKIFGSPYSLPFGNWAFMKPDHVLYNFYKQIPDNVNILITHCAPFGILDMAINGDMTGSRSLIDRTRELKSLKLSLFGHIHEEYGILQKNNITFVNASVLDERYRLKNRPIVIEYV